MPFCLCICVLGISFWEISDEGFGRHHFRAHVSGYETFCLRKWFKILNLIRSYRVFWTPTKWLSNFQIKYSKTVQNTSVTILDHQKSIIAKKKSYFLENVKNSYFQKTWDCTKISKSMIFSVSSLWRFHQKCVWVAIWRFWITQTKKLYWSFREGLKMFIKNLIGTFTDMITKSPKLVLLCLYLFW